MLVILKFLGFSTVEALIETEPFNDARSDALIFGVTSFSDYALSF